MPMIPMLILLSIILTVVVPYSAWAKNEGAATHKSYTAWKGMLRHLDVRGFRFDGTDIYAAVPNGQGDLVKEFFNAALVPKFLQTSEYMTLSKSVAEIQRDINIQNRPVFTSTNLVWLRITHYLPKGLIEFMNSSFKDGTNCFRVALFFNGVSIESGFISENTFLQNVVRYFRQSTSSNSDLAVIYQRGKPIHAYIPIGETGWVLTKNGTGELQPLRFMRESELISYYSTLRDHSRSERFSWEESAIPISVEYFDFR